MDMFITFIVVMVLWVCAYLQDHQMVYIKYAQFFVYQLYLSKTVFFFLIKQTIRGLDKVNRDLSVHKILKYQIRS